MPSFTLQPENTLLLIVDMQEKIFATVDRGPDVLRTLCKFVKGFQILRLPILVSEQYPQGLGKTVEPLKGLLGDLYRPYIKTTFSCLDDPKFIMKFSLCPISNALLSELKLISVFCKQSKVY